MHINFLSKTSMIQRDALEDLDIDGGCVQRRSLVNTIKNEGGV
jgi:hypothetical protein